MLPYLNLGPIGLPTAPLIYIAGAWLALFAVDRAARRLGQAAEPVYGLATVALLGGFIGARLVFVLLHWSSYDDNLLGIVWPLTSGYNAAGGVLISLAAAFFYGRWRRLPLWPTLDALAPGLLIFLMAVSLADFLGGAGYGSLTAMPWGIDQFGVRRHAVQLYEVAAGAVALGVWLVATSNLTVLERPARQHIPGRPFLLATTTYAAGRLFVDAYHQNATVVFGGYHVVQLVSLVALVAALVMLARSSSAGADEQPFN